VQVQPSRGTIRSDLNASKSSSGCADHDNLIPRLYIPPAHLNLTVSSGFQTGWMPVIASRVLALDPSVDCAISGNSSCSGTCSHANSLHAAVVGGAPPCLQRDTRSKSSSSLFPAVLNHSVFSPGLK
jgi:hypothetical protein